MCVSQIVKFRRIASAGALAALMLYGSVRADVLEEVPSDAMAVLKIKDLESLNTKVAKMAKTFGLDELKPEMKDPLNALLEAGHMTKGVNKAGDAALVLFAPEKGAAKQEPIAVALVPVSDYDAFVGNFKKTDGADAGGEISTVQDPEEAGKSMYVAHRGHYAIVSDKKEHLTAQDKGIKLSGAAAHDADTKDAVFFFNMKVVRAKALPELKTRRKEWLDELHKNIAGEEKVKQFLPVIDTVMNEGMDVAETFLNDADSVVFSMSLSDEGLTGGGLVQFAPDSKYGKYAAQLKPTSTPLLAGLPDHKYFLFGGSSLDAKVLSPMADEMLDPVIKGLKDTNNDIGKRFASMLESLKTVTSSSTHQAMGWVMPSKPLGQESIFQQIAVTYGDAKAIAGAQKSMLGDLNDLMALAPNGGAKAKTEFGAMKEVDGVQLQTYSTKLEVDENDPKGMQAQQMLAMMYGPNGMSGSFGAIDDKTFITSQGASDELLKEAIEAAKSKNDSLTNSAGVKTVNAQLPKENLVVYYVALDNIVTSAVKYAQGFGVPIKMKLPQNLPPIGISAGAEGSAVRIDGFIPATTVQSLIAAGIDAYTQMQQKGQGGGL